MSLLTRPPPLEIHKMPASGPAFCLNDAIGFASGRAEVAPKDDFRLLETPID